MNNITNINVGDEAIVINEFNQYNDFKVGDKGTVKFIGKENVLNSALVGIEWEKENQEFHNGAGYYIGKDNHCYNIIEYNLNNISFRKVKNLYSTIKISQDIIKKNIFKKGDRIIVIKDFEQGVNFKVGDKGTVKYIYGGYKDDEIMALLIEWNFKREKFHNCAGMCKDGCGYDIFKENFKYLKVM